MKNCVCFLCFAQNRARVYVNIYHTDADFDCSKIINFFGVDKWKIKAIILISTRKQRVLILRKYYEYKVIKMRKKQFKAESKKLLDMMINSIYTNKEIFIRELISNASDAIDKLYFKSLTDNSVGLSKDDFEIRLDVDSDERTITISDNGIGMTGEELEANLGTIAKSGSLNFKNENEEAKENDIEWKRAARHERRNRSVVCRPQRRTHTLPSCRSSHAAQGQGGG